MRTFQKTGTKGIAGHLQRFCWRIEVELCDFGTIYFLHFVSYCFTPALICHSTCHSHLSFWLVIYVSKQRANSSWVWNEQTTIPIIQCCPVRSDAHWVKFEYHQTTWCHMVVHGPMHFLPCRWYLWKSHITAFQSKTDGWIRWDPVALHTSIICSVYPGLAGMLLVQKLWELWRPTTGLKETKGWTAGKYEA